MRRFTAIRAMWMALAMCCACAGGSSSDQGALTGNAGSTASPGAPWAANAGGTSSTATPGAGASNLPPVCGNGALTRNEACDDGNTASGDGCGADCLAIETGYACQPPGQPCRVIQRCGDGIVAASEACDDANATDQDGCSARCKIELGWKCDGEPSACSATTCGDAQPEGIEGCDDGNAKAGDGCSAACELEPGFTCTTETSCEPRGDQCILRVAAIFRDFAESHSDFGIGCGQLTLGVAAPQLSADGKPVLANGSAVCIESADSFRQWYTDNPNNATIVGELTLYENGRGGFVNRYGPNGEQWVGRAMYTNITWGGPPGSGCSMCTPSAAGQCFDPCVPWNDMNQACCAESSQQVYDGNPLFFPVDDAPNALTDTRFRAKIPAEYGYDGWPYEDTVFPGAPAHDFHFTTEVVYWFKYDASTSAVLDFTGDDDVWVFVNRRLAVDLGGPHVPEDGSVTIDAQSAGRFGLSAGNVYEVRVFHAERKIEGSTFKLTLSGFNISPSDCTPICGDGVVTAGEECDDGVNDGGYEECAAGCVLGARCGDNVVQSDEDCDDGNRRDGDGCGSACRRLVVD